MRPHHFEMCNLYQSTPGDRINARHFVSLPLLAYAETIAPLKPCPFEIAGGASAVGLWGMIPHNSKTRKPMTIPGRGLEFANMLLVYAPAWGTRHVCAKPYAKPRIHIARWRVPSGRNGRPQGISP
jgi:hypothetical protein